MLHPLDPQMTVERFNAMADLEFLLIRLGGCRQSWVRLREVTVFLKKKKKYTENETKRDCSAKNVCPVFIIFNSTLLSNTDKRFIIRPTCFLYLYVNPQIITITF